MTAKVIRNAVRARKVALPIDTLVPFTGDGHVERAVCVTEIGAHHIVPRAIATRDERISAAGRIVAAGAVGFTRRKIAAVIVAVLARRPQHIELEAADISAIRTRSNG